MSRYTKPQVKDEERDLRIAIMRLELREMLWRQVTIPDSMVYIALGLGGDSSWQVLKTTGDAPPRITINQRVFVLTADLRAWLEKREKTSTTRGQQRKNGQHGDTDRETHEPDARTRPTPSFSRPLAPG